MERGGWGRNEQKEIEKALIATVDIPFLMWGWKITLVGGRQCSERCRVLRTVVVYTTSAKNERERNGGGWGRNERGGAD